MARISLLSAALAAACLVALSAGPANAQDRSHGARAFMRAMAATATNQSSIRQDGSNNGAAIAQTGQGNTAGIRQYGDGHTGTITQVGDNNAACLIQVGRGLDGSITQVGDNNSTGVIQTRHGARPIPAELCALDTDRRGFWMGAVRQAARRMSR